VFIAPQDYVPSDGSMANPARSRFWVSWQDETDSKGVLETAVLVGAEAAIDWGRVRSEVVWIRLGNRGGTYFSAGVQHPADAAHEKVPHWPPDGPPVQGWWEPPPRPDRNEIRSIDARVVSGELSKADAKQWAELRLNVYGSELDPETVRELVVLTQPK
jgi:hypothetical protein